MKVSTNTSKKLALFFAISLVNCSSNLVTLEYQPAKHDTYYEYILAQSLVKVIDDQFQVHYEPQTHYDFLISTTISRNSDGQRIQTEFIEQNQASKQSNYLKTIDFPSLLQQLIAANPPEYLVNSSGEVVSVNLTDEYRQNFRIATQTLYRNINNKKLADEQVDKLINQLEEYDFLSSIKRTRINISSLNGLTLKNGDEPVKGASLYSQSSVPNGSAFRGVQFKGHIPCHEKTLENNCVVLQEVMRADENGKKRRHDPVVNSIKTVVTDPDTLQVFSIDTTDSSEQQFYHAKKKYSKEEFIQLKRVFLNGKPEESTLTLLRNHYYKQLGFESRSADLSDFLELHQTQIRKIRDAHRLCKATKADSDLAIIEMNNWLYRKQPCATLKNFYNDPDAMHTYDHFLSQIEPTPTGFGGLAESFLEKRIHTLITLELLQLRTSNPDISSDKLRAQIPDIARTLISESPITGVRHQRYLEKIPDYYSNYLQLRPTDNKPERPKR